VLALFELITHTCFYPCVTVCYIWCSEEAVRSRFGQNSVTA